MEYIGNKKLSELTARCQVLGCSLIISSVGGKVMGTFSPLDFLLNREGEEEEESIWF